MKSCVVCGGELKPVEVACCARCVSSVRADLARVDYCYRLLPALLGRPDGASLGTVMGGKSDAAALPGGDILVMLGPGSSTGNGQQPDDPPAVAHELWLWCRDWAEQRGEAKWPRKVVKHCTHWLNARLTWSMNHYGRAADFADDMSRIRTRLEAVTHTSEAPEYGETCPYCGGTLQRGWSHKGRDDDWSCPRCHRNYSPAQYRLAVMMVLGVAQERNVG